VFNVPAHPFRPFGYAQGRLCGPGSLPGTGSKAATRPATFFVFQLASGILVVFLYFVNYFVRVNDFLGNNSSFFTQLFKGFLCG